MERSESRKNDNFGKSSKFQLGISGTVDSREFPVALILVLAVQRPVHACDQFWQ